MKNFTLLLALIACFFNLKAQELNVPTGKQFSYTTHSKGKGTSNFDIKYTYLFTSLGKDADGNQVFECKLTRAQEKDGRDLSKTILDTDNLYSTDFNHSSVLDKLALIQRPFKMVLSPKGKLLKLDGHEKIMAEVGEKWNLDTIYSSKMSRRNEVLKSEIQKMFFQFPEGPVNADGGWKGKDGYNYKMKASDNNPPALTKINNEVPGMNNKSALNNKQKAKRLVEVEYSINGGMKETGKYILDAETGLIQSLTGNRSFEADYGSVRWVANDEITQTIGNDLKDQKHDTAWVKINFALYKGCQRGQTAILCTVKPCLVSLINI
ncbi:MAG: hypothetical protein EOO92_10695 [Pedobacter sp.]|nr:MAG: hypothetical protein EOO92_10695 [Pedobacter sp.]